MISTRSASTAVNKHKGLQHYFKWLVVDEQAIGVSPMQRVRMPKTPTKLVPVLRDEDAGRLLAAGNGTGFANLPDEALIRLYANTGAACPRSATPRRGPGPDPNAMARLFDRTCRNLAASLDRTSDTDLARTMPFPTRWDPFFTERKSRLDMYHYPWQHFEFHRRQLTLDPSAAAGRALNASASHRRHTHGQEHHASASPSKSLV
jgi:hypothetical protein